MQNQNCFRISAYTRDGFSSLINQYLRKTRKIVVLKGKFGCHYTNLLTSLVKRLQSENRKVIIFQHSLLENGIEGLLIEDKGVLIIEEILLPKNVKKPIEEINLTGLYDETMLINKEKDITSLESNIQTSLQFVMKHFLEASSFVKERDNLIRKYTNIQLLNSKKNHLLHSLFSSIKRKPSKLLNEKRFIEPNTNINLQNFSLEKVEKPIKLLFLKNNFSNFIMGEIEQKAKDLNLQLVRYVSPIFPLQTSMLILPELNTVIFKRIAANDINITGDSLQEVDFSHSLTSQFYDFKSKKKINDLEANCSIKMTLALNYLKEARLWFEELASMYENAKGIEKDNLVTESLLEIVKVTP
ncbi:hypothetical protein CIB95_08465 [Lottiidibacillus patelloidae]|uniref:Uncharacterized protein n=1 Tax=Lottiidibacillus patelloidae TaxID=2670334 RepID=A0A263BVX5_9BACI|nr:hypothetical protein [Lottiidibacillus patelloidae]OZM57477.1 hypothetical protein CIB95_08465 [Lottiidibacillus patelloidae]